MTAFLRRAPAAFAAALAAPSAALAVSIGDMADAAADNLDAVGPLLAALFYVIGIALVGFGLVRLKRHVDQPQQATLAASLITICIGVALLMAPTLINGVAETFGIVGGDTVDQPRL